MSIILSTAVWQLDKQQREPHRSARRLTAAAERLGCNAACRGRRLAELHPPSPAPWTSFPSARSGTDAAHRGSGSSDVSFPLPSLHPPRTSRRPRPRAGSRKLLPPRPREQQGNTQRFPRSLHSNSPAPAAAGNFPPAFLCGAAGRGTAPGRAGPPAAGGCGVGQGRPLLTCVQGSGCRAAQGLLPPSPAKMAFRLCSCCKRSPSSVGTVAEIGGVGTGY